MAQHIAFGGGSSRGVSSNTSTSTTTNTTTQTAPSPSATTTTAASSSSPSTTASRAYREAQAAFIDAETSRGFSAGNVSIALGSYSQSKVIRPGEITIIKYKRATEYYVS